MPRPRKQRKCTCPHRAAFSVVYKPAGTPLKDLAVVHLEQDELEALHLCDGEEMTQEEAGACMEVSRGTVQRLLASARRKVAQALVGRKALVISRDAPEGGGDLDSLKGAASEVGTWATDDVFADLVAAAKSLGETDVSR